jgi:hypothetical protein
LTDISLIFPIVGISIKMMEEEMLLLEVIASLKKPLAMLKSYNLFETIIEKANSFGINSEITTLIR